MRPVVLDDLAGLIVTSTSSPRRRTKLNSRSRENPEIRPFTSAETSGCAICSAFAALACVSSCSRMRALIRTASCALSSSSSGLSRPRSAKTFPLPRMTFVSVATHSTNFRGAGHSSITISGTTLLTPFRGCRLIDALSCSPYVARDHGRRRKPRPTTTPTAIRCRRGPPTAPSCWPWPPPSATRRARRSS